MDLEIIAKGGGGQMHKDYVAAPHAKGRYGNESVI